LQILDWGGHGPVLIFLPGFGTGAHIFDELAPAFVDGYHVVALTPRGFPPSSAPDSGYTIGQLASDVAAVMDSLGARQAILAGHSISGAVITRFAQAYPERLRAAVYLDAAFDFGTVYRRGHDPKSSLHPSPGDSTSPAYLEWLSRYEEKSRAAETDWRMWQIDSTDAARRKTLVLPLADEVRAAPHEVWRVRAPALSLQPSASFDRQFGWLRPDSVRWDRARALHRDSQRAAHAACDEFEGAAPHRRCVVLESGHFVFLDRRDETVRQMHRFLNRLE
jgi:pimeloyl-ACP methyl ester carboxylesterase